MDFCTYKEIRPMHRILFLSSCLSFLFFISASSIHADTVVITGGTMRLTPSSVSMNFTSSNVIANMGATHTFANVPCSICSAGQTLSLSGSSGGFGPFDAFGSLVVNGVQYFVIQQLLPPPLPNVILTGGVSFLADSLIVPRTTDPFITLTAPFRVTGGVNAIGGPFTLIFEGSGIASLELRNIGLNSQGNNLYLFQGVTYAFQTPEPITFVLLATGLIGGLLQLRRRSRSE
jgi:hypothetical protein